jgi:hypothetical protein
MSRPCSVAAAGALAPVLALQLATAPGVVPGRPATPPGVVPGRPATPRRSVSTYRDVPGLRNSLLLKPVHVPPGDESNDPEPRVLARLPANVLNHVLVQSIGPGGRVQPGLVDPIKPLRLEMVKASAVTDAIRAQTEVEVRIIPEWGREWVGLPIRRDEVWRSMERLAVAFGGSWYAVQEKWILADSASAARITALPEAEYFELTMPVHRKLFQSITPGQWRLLASGTAIPLRRLARGQQETLLLLIKLNRYFFGPPGSRPTDGAMRGDGVLLALTGSEDPTLDVLIPVLSRFGKPQKPTLGISISFTGKDGELLWGVPPPR